MPRRVAACVTGLERSYADLADNFARAVLQPHPMLTLFGVRPVQGWPNVRLPFADVAEQWPCAIMANRSYDAAARRRDRRAFFPEDALPAFFRELCDLRQCEALIAAHERRRAMRFDAIVRTRLDLFWELPPVPRPVTRADEIALPAMSACGGVCDKFAIGGRHAMRAYLSRLDDVERIFFDPRRRRDRLNSERVLDEALRLHGVTVRRDPLFMFCKFGKRSRHHFRPWPECTRRIAARICCDTLHCDWCGRGCRCVSARCPPWALASRTCFLPSSPTGRSDYAHRAGGVGIDECEGGRA